jgi:serine/threonine protein kinase
LREVDHPNIVKAHNVFEDKCAYPIVTDLCQGGELLDLIVEKASGQGLFPERDVARLLSELLSAVKYLHSIDIVHQDMLSLKTFSSLRRTMRSPIMLIDLKAAPS